MYGESLEHVIHAAIQGDAEHRHVRRPDQIDQRVGVGVVEDVQRLLADDNMSLFFRRQFLQGVRLFHVGGLGDFFVVGAVPVDVGQDREAVGQGESPDLADPVNDLLGTGDVQPAVGHHEIILRIDIPEYDIRIHDPFPKSGASFFLSPHRVLRTLVA